MAAFGAAAPAGAATTQVFNAETNPDVITPITIGASATPQYDFYKNSSQVQFLSTNGDALINPTPFSSPGLPSAGETFSSEPSGLALTPSSTGDVYYHLNFDIGNEKQIGFADFSPDTTELYSVTYASAAPEPATWAELLLGVGAAGLALRQVRARRQSQAMA